MRTLAIIIPALLILLAGFLAAMVANGEDRPITGFATHQVDVQGPGVGVIPLQEGPYGEVQERYEDILEDYYQ